MRCRVRSILGVSLLSALCAMPLSAQFKPKLSKLNPLAKKEAGGSKAPTFNDRVLEITNQRADQLLKGYAAEAAALRQAARQQAVARAAYEEENKKHPARMKEYETSHAAWKDCQAKYVAPAEAKAKKDVQQNQDEITGGDQAAFERRMEDIKKRIQAAQAAGDMDEVMRLADSLQKGMGNKSAAVANQASAEMQAANEKCGAEPVRPEPPTPPSQQGPNLDDTGAKGAGLTVEQYAILKERVQAAVAEDGQVQVPSSMWAYGSGELAVLEKRGPELNEAYAPIRDQGH
jgi:4-alpha-glucanotransferase